MNRWAMFECPSRDTAAQLVALHDSAVATMNRWAMFECPLRDTAARRVVAGPLLASAVRGGPAGLRPVRWIGTPWKTPCRPQGGRLNLAQRFIAG